MAYSTETRLNALKDYVEGQTTEEVSAKHGISPYTLGNWKKLLLTTGSLDKKKTERKSGKPYKYTPDKIKEQLDKSLPAKVAAAPKDTRIQDGAKVKDSTAFKVSKDVKDSPKTKDSPESTGSRKDKKDKKKKKKKSKKD